MKMIWKVLGAAALVVGLTPYKVEKDEDTGAKKYQALLWQGTKTPHEGEKDALDITIGFKMPKEENEPHLFSDELCVEYTGAPVTGEKAEAEAPAEAAEEPVAPVAPVEPVAPVAPVAPIEPVVPAEAPAEEEKEEA